MACEPRRSCCPRRCSGVDERCKRNPAPGCKARQGQGEPGWAGLGLGEVFSAGRIRVSAWALESRQKQRPLFWLGGKKGGAGSSCGALARQLLALARGSLAPGAPLLPCKKRGCDRRFLGSEAKQPARGAQARRGTQTHDIIDSETAKLRQLKSSEVV